MALFPRLFFTLQPGFFRDKTRFSGGGALGFLFPRLNLGFRLTKVLHQRNMAGANIGARAAFYAGGQAMLARLFMKIGRQCG